MERDIYFTEIPNFDEIIDFLPVASNDREDVVAYIQNIKNLVSVNYRYNQYQFAYFGVHLLYMTYIYCTAWKISKMNEKRYINAMTFARPYNGREKEFRDSDSVFKYSLLPEKEIGKIFHLIGLDTGQIGIINGIVVNRDDMAHASGKISIPNEDEFQIKSKTVLTSMTNIHNSMKKLIRQWFGKVLVEFCLEDETDFDVYENIVSDYNLSIKEAHECNEMSIKDILEKYPHIEVKLKTRKEEMRDFYEAYVISEESFI